MTRTVAVANQKGGVGKTTTAASLAAWFAECGVEVLLIDLDPQGNLTSSLGVDRETLQYTTYDLLLGEATIPEVTLPEIRPGLGLVAARRELAGAEVELATLEHKEFQLRRALHGQIDLYDLVLIDCPPSLGLLTINALSAATDVIIPIQCEYLALEGLMQLVGSMELIKRRVNPALDILGVVMTMYDARTRLAADVVENVRQHFPGHSFATIIPRSVRLAEAPSYGQSIVEYAPGSPGAVAYRELTLEVAARLGIELRADAGPHLATEPHEHEEALSTGNGM